MTNEELAHQTRKALEEFNRLPPEERITRLVLSGTINKEGDVMLGREDRWQQKQGVDQLKRALQIIMNHLDEHARMREDAKKKKSVQKMRLCLDAVYNDCQRFQKAYPSYFPESQRLDNVFQVVESCNLLPTETEKEREVFISKTDECLTLLRSEVEKLL